MNTQMPIKEIPPIDIIMGDHTCQNGEAERVLDVINHRLEQDNSLLVRKYNSLYLVTRLNDGTVEGHFYSVDPALYAVRATKYFIDETKKSGAKALYISDFSDPKMKRMLEMIDLTVEPSDKQEYKHMVNFTGSA